MLKQVKSLRREVVFRAWFSGFDSERNHVTELVTEEYLHLSRARREIVWKTEGDLREVETGKRSHLFGRKGERSWTRMIKQDRNGCSSLALSELNVLYKKNDSRIWVIWILDVVATIDDCKRIS